MNLYPEMDAKIVGILRMSDTSHHLYAAALIESLQGRLKESEKGRENDREKFREGVEAWQKRIKEAEEKRDLLTKAKRIIRKLLGNLRGDNDYIAQIENDAAYARGEWREEKEQRIEAERSIQLAQETIAKRLRNCAWNFHEENPDGCEGPCESFGCKTLRGIRDTLKECSADTVSSLERDQLGVARVVPVHKCDRCGTERFQGTMCWMCLRPDKG